MQRPHTGKKKTYEIAAVVPVETSSMKHTNILNRGGLENTFVRLQKEKNQAQESHANKTAKQAGVRNGYGTE